MDNVLGRLSRSVGLIALLAPTVWFSGCDSGGGGPAGPAPPEAIEVRLSAPAVQVTRTITATAVAVDQRDAFDVTWLVDGVVGGSDSTGTIIQRNPATYTAPAAVPEGARVVIEARLESGPSVSASDTLSILFTVVYVDAAAGDDGSGTGGWAAPFRTVTAGLGAADAGDTVFVGAGTYGPAIGESPPYAVPAGVTLRGASADSCTLLGSGDEGNVVELGVGAGVERFTIGNADRDHTAVYSTPAGSIRRIVVTDPFLYSPFRCSGETLIEDCRLENTRDPQTGRGMELLEASHATVRRCTLRGWYQGAFVNGTSDPRIEYSVFEDNVLGLDTYQTDLEYTEPDLGGGLRNSQGANIIRGNSSCGLANRTPGTIYAINNTWNVPAPDPPVVCSEIGDSCDICNTNTGVVFWCECRRP